NEGERLGGDGQTECHRGDEPTNAIGPPKKTYERPARRGDGRRYEDVALGHGDSAVREVVRRKSQEPGRQDRHFGAEQLPGEAGRERDSESANGDADRTGGGEIFFSCNAERRGAGVHGEPKLRRVDRVRLSADRGTGDGGRDVHVHPLVPKR